MYLYYYLLSCIFFFFNDTATTEIYTLSLHDALPIFHDVTITLGLLALTQLEFNLNVVAALLTLIGYSLNDTIVVYDRDRKSTRLNSSHANISYAVFCLKKKNKKYIHATSL